MAGVPPARRPGSAGMMQARREEVGMAQTPSAGGESGGASPRLPPDHPQRAALTEELHARPTEAMAAPLRVSSLALLCGGGPEREAAWAAVRDLALRLGAPPPPPGAIHHSTEMGGFRLKWEQHTEFYRCMV